MTEIDVQAWDGLRAVLADRLGHAVQQAQAMALRQALQVRQRVGIAQLRIQAHRLVVAAVLHLPGAHGQALAVAADDTVEKVLAAQKGKRVTVKLGPGDELTGVVKLVTPQVVHLGEIAGREFFDAVVDTKRVVAVLVRVK